MSIFLVGVIPLLFIFLKESFSPLQRSSFFAILIKGLLFFIPSFLIFLIFRNIIPVKYTFWGHYFLYGFRDVFFWVLLSIGFFFLARLHRAGTARDCSYAFISFFTGLITPLAITDLITHSKWQNSYTLFLVPMIRIILLFLLSALISGSVYVKYEKRYLYIAGLIATVLLLPLIPAFYYTYQIFLSFVLGIIFLGLSGFFLFFTLKEDLLWEIPDLLTFFKKGKGLKLG